MGNATGPHRILIVDDTPAVREALRWAFEDIGTLEIVGEAESGKQAIQQASDLQPEVVILDIELPDLTGFRVAQTLKALPQAPLIIFLSVHNDATTKQRCRETGGDGFVEKSKGWLALIEKIQEVLVSG